MSTSSEFGSQLTNLGFPPVGFDPAALAAQALARNRRRIRRLAALTIGLWIIAFLMVPALWMPFAKKVKHEMLILSGTIDPSGAPASAPADLETVRKVVHQTLFMVAMVSGWILAVMTLASLLAAISTVWLVLTVRRVTLEQVSLGLAQISEQLQRLGGGTAGPR